MPLVHVFVLTLLERDFYFYIEINIGKTDQTASIYSSSNSRVLRDFYFYIEINIEKTDQTASIYSSSNSRVLRGLFAFSTINFVISVSLNVCGKKN